MNTSVFFSQSDLFDSRPLTEYSQHEEEYIINLALEILTRKHAPGEALTSPGHVKQYLQLHVRDMTNEVFGCLFLSSQHHIIAVEDIFYGTIDGAAVYPRVIVEKCIHHNAAAVIAYHNHPSSIAEPSSADKRITSRIQDALKLIDVRLLDHLVVTATDTSSFAEMGLL